MVIPDRFIPSTETFGKIKSLPEMKNPNTTVADATMKTSVATNDIKNRQTLLITRFMLSTPYTLEVNTIVLIYQMRRDKST